MLATFCLRLAVGLVAALCLLSPSQVNPRFYRTQFLVALGLAALAAVLLWETADAKTLAALGAALASAFLGSVVWSLDRAPGGRAAVGLTALSLLAALGLAGWRGAPAWVVLDDLTSAALLGAATAAMLMGHSYLVAPAMSITPLMRLLAALAVALLLRAAVAGYGLGCWTAGQAPGNVTDVTVLWLPLRWGLGVVGPLVLGWMAWQTARIRSTQSATGILYVVVIFCFLGELTSQLLQAANRLPL